MKSIKTNPNSAKGSLRMCEFVKLFVDEEHVLKSNRGRTKTMTDSTRKRHKKEDLTSLV
jgi:hypothetical protein